MGDCEWAPIADRASFGGDDAYACPNQAELSVGSDGRWHLCSSCAALPRFSRFRSRKPLRKPKQQE